MLFFWFASQQVGLYDERNEQLQQEINELKVDNTNPHPTQQVNQPLLHLHSFAFLCFPLFSFAFLCFVLFVCSVNEEVK